MTFESIYLIIDNILITPYRMDIPSVAAFWIGTSILAIWCIILGEICMSLGYLWNRKYYNGLNKEMIRMHNISIEAILRKDKKIFKSSNEWANEYFGKVFFAHAALFAISLWPVPFALGWLQKRFSGIDIHTIPVLNFGLEYPFVFISAYIILRYLFSKVRKYIPGFKRVDQIKEDDASESGEMKSWNDLVPEKKTVDESRAIETVFTDNEGAKTAS